MKKILISLLFFIACISIIAEYNIVQEFTGEFFLKTDKGEESPKNEALKEKKEDVGNEYFSNPLLFSRFAKNSNSYPVHIDLVYPSGFSDKPYTPPDSPWLPPFHLFISPLIID